MPSQDSTRWWYAAEAALGLAIVSLPVCLGGAPPWTAVVLFGLALVALTTWVVGAVRHGRRATWHPVLAVLAFLTLVAALALVPLPPPLLALLSPEAAELRDFALVPLGLEAPRPLTVDAPSTWRALARLASLLAIGFVALQLGRLEASRRRLLMVIAGTGGLVAVVGFGHLLAGADALFGQWRFFATLPLLSFFGNSNHLAAWLAFCGTVALGLGLEARSREAAVGWVGLGLACGTGVFLSFSRGGIGTFVVTWAMVGALLLARRQGGVRAVLPWLVIGATTLFALSLASEQLIERLASVSTVERLQKTKLDLWPMFWEAAVAYGRAGMGPGAFELGFTRFQTTQPGVTFTHPENLVLQGLAELGVPLFTVLLALGLFAAWRLVRQARGALLEQVLLLAVLGAGLHDLFDFALELNALPVAVVVVLGLCGAREQGLAPQRWAVRGWWSSLPAALAVVGVVALAKGLPPHGAAEEALLGLVDEGASAEQVRAAALVSIDRHPADWVLYAAVADRFSREGAARESLAWVNRVLSLRPFDASAHVVAGRALRRLNQPTQALLEFKVAWTLGDTASFDEGLTLAAALGAYDRLLVEDAGLLGRMWERYRVMGLLAESKALLAAAEQLPPSQAVAMEARVLQVWQANAEQDFPRALGALEQLPLEVRAQPELLILSARLLAQVGRLAEAIAQLDAVARREPQHLNVATTLAELLALDKRPREALAALDRTRPFVSGPQGRSLLFQREAGLWAQEGRWPRALEALQTAARIEPTRADLRYRIAEVYEQMGSLHSAIDEVRKGRLLDTPQGAKAQDAWVSRLQLAMEAQRTE